jgi:hypothetical protein
LGKPPIPQSVDRRTEPRFSIASRVKVTLLSSLDRQIDCRMVDLSATGMRFISNEVLPADEIVAVDFEDHLAVATIRHCQRYGDKFSIGTSRIHSLPKDQLPAGKPQYEQIRALLEEKGWLVEIETGDPAPVLPPEAEVATVTEEAAPAAEVPPLAEGAPTVEVLPETEAATVAEVAEVSPLDAAPAPPVPSPSQAPAESAIPLETETQEPVSHPPDAQSAAGSRRGLIAVAILVLLIAAGVLVLRTRHQASTRDTVAAAAPEAPPAPVEEPPVPPIAKQPTATPGPTVHQVHLAILNPAWVSATADGKAVLGKMLAKGDSDEFQFSRVAFVHLGNSSGVAITLDGKPLQLAGDSGPLRLVQITPDGGRILPWTNGDPASSLAK